MVAKSGNRIAGKNAWRPAALSFRSAPRNLPQPGDDNRTVQDGKTSRLGRMAETAIVRAYAGPANLRVMPLLRAAASSL